MSNPERNLKFKDFDGTLSSFYRFSPHNLFCEATLLLMAQTQEMCYLVFFKALYKHRSHFKKR